MRELLGERAGELGFSAVGVAGVEPLEGARRHLEQWLDRGYQGKLHYLERPAARADPRTWAVRSRAAVVVALPLPDPDRFAPRGYPEGQDALLGEIARFARYRSYPAVVCAKLEKLRRAFEELLERPLIGPTGADSAPLLERALAARAGVGFVTESALLSVPGHGSHVVLGELLVEEDLQPDPPLATRCSSCGACRRACPSGALREPFVVEARRCVSYLTQTAGIVPRALRPAMGRWIYGCDECQRVCPENSGLPQGALTHELGEPLSRPLLTDLLAPVANVRALMGSGRLAEAARNLLGRNAAIALGNSRREDARPALTRALEAHPSPIVRAHAAWGLGQSADAAVHQLLLRSRRHDPDARVREEALAALEGE